MPECKESNSHSVYFDILKKNNIDGLHRDFPLWKLSISTDDYEKLKSTLIVHSTVLESYGDEAAICYAEWWRRDYQGGVPSKEKIATSLGLDSRFADTLFVAAKESLRRRGYTFIRSQFRCEYFRTLLNQGGLPLNYIMKANNLGAFSRFLRGLVEELSSINYNWNEIDISVIKQFNCISYLSDSFKNDSIYDVSMQIAHAIIREDKSLLPYDEVDSNSSLKELTRSLEVTYKNVRNRRQPQPFSLHWKLRLVEEKCAVLFVNMEVVKSISSVSIPDLDVVSCYAFDVFVEGHLVGKYERKGICREGEVGQETAEYVLITAGWSNDILWKGNPVVEVKLRCDDGQRHLLTVAGCYPPNFESPQVFQMLDDKLYSLGGTGNTEHNLAIFSQEWEVDGSSELSIHDELLSCCSFEQKLDVQNKVSGERVSLTNSFTHYKAEFLGNYLAWVESSNYKLLKNIPIIKVYDKEKNCVSAQKKLYRLRGESPTEWHTLKLTTILPTGIVYIRVQFPDGNFVTEKFYSIGSMKFGAANADLSKTEITCEHTDLMVEIDKQEYLNIENLCANRWRLSREEGSLICPSTCHFGLYKLGQPTLHLTVAIPFKGVSISDVSGNLIPNGKIISLTNLSNYCIVNPIRRSHQSVDVSYKGISILLDKEVKHLKGRAIDSSVVPLADYYELIQRMFNLYGSNSFDRSSSVVLSIGGKEVLIRKFVLESTIIDDTIYVIDTTEKDTEDFEYKDDLYVFPVGDDLISEDFRVTRMERVEEEKNSFRFPSDFTHREVVVFSGPEAHRRIVPKYYHRDSCDFCSEQRMERAKQNILDWADRLQESDVTERAWIDVATAFSICSKYNLPFTTYNGLKPIASSSELLVKMIIALLIHGGENVLRQEINRFEQEMAVALHWVPKAVWDKSLLFLGKIPDYYLIDFANLVKDLLRLTVSPDISTELEVFILLGQIKETKKLTYAEIHDYCAQINGLSLDNKDLPVLQFDLEQKGYYPSMKLLPSYRTMIESAMCAAENICQVENAKDLFSKGEKEYARVVNFYRNYFKETYYTIFLKTIKII